MNIDVVLLIYTSGATLEPLHLQVACLPTKLLQTVGLGAQDHSGFPGDWGLRLGYGKVEVWVTPEQLFCSVCVCVCDEMISVSGLNFVTAGSVSYTASCGEHSCTHAAIVQT